MTNEPTTSTYPIGQHPKSAFSSYSTKSAVQPIPCTHESIQIDSKAPSISRARREIKEAYKYIRDMFNE